jgi:hypothetical protein
MLGFGGARYFILFDAYSGYHQIKIAESSAIKTAFFAPHGCKDIWTVKPFGLRNAPAVFIAMIHNLKEFWSQECEKANIKPSPAR